MQIRQIRVGERSAQKVVHARVAGVHSRQPPHPHFLRCPIPSRGTRRQATSDLLQHSHQLLQIDKTKSEIFGCEVRTQNILYNKKLCCARIANRGELCVGTESQLLQHHTHRIKIRIAVIVFVTTNSASHSSRKYSGSVHLKRT